MKKGVWTGILVLLLVSSFIYAQDETIVDPEVTPYRISVAPAYSGPIGALIRSFDVTDQTQLNVQSKWNNYAANNYQGAIYLTPQEAVVVAREIGDSKTWLGTSRIVYQHVQSDETTWDTIQSNQVSQPQAYFLPGSALPGANDYTTSEPDQGVTC